MRLGQKITISLLRIKFRILIIFSKKQAARKAVELFCTPQLQNKKKLPALFEHSGKLNFIINGVTVHGYRWNHPSKSKALILHGFDSSAVNFEQYVQPLVDKGYEVLAFDAPAHGQSGGDRITVPVYRDMILYIAEHYGPIHSYMAHSMGGQALALAMEKINHDHTWRIVLIAPATESSTAFVNFFKFLHIRNAEVKNLFDKLIVEMSGHPLSWFSITRAMQNIKATILWLHDDDDKITPLNDTLKIKAKNYPGLKFVITHGLGHRRIYRDRKVLNSVIDFL